PPTSEGLTAGRCLRSSARPSGCTCQFNQTGWPGALAKCGTVVQPASAFAFPIPTSPTSRVPGTPGNKTPQLPVICELHTTRTSHRLSHLSTIDHLHTRHPLAASNIDALLH